MADLRKDKRAPASLKVKYKSATVDEFSEQFGTDVSRGGIFIKTKKPIENGALLKLELQLNDASPVIAGIGRVCWRRENSTDPNLPSGMGIKFLKLEPESAAVVERILQGRGARPSRFDQMDGADIAAVSEPPGELSVSVVPSAPPAKAAPSAAAAPAQMKPAAPKPIAAAAPAPAAPAPKAAAKPAPPAASATAGTKPFLAAKPAATAGTAGTAPKPKVAGLFADSPLARQPAPEAKAESGARSSFFPPAPGAAPAIGPAARVPVPGTFGAAKIAPPPPAVGSVPPPSPSSSIPPAAKASPFQPAARASHARQSGQFLATAFAEGGLAEETTKQARAAAEATEDQMIDELFAGVVDDEPKTRSVPAPPPSPPPMAPEPASVDDVFAAISEEEGLSEPPPARRSSVPALPAARASQPGFDEAKTSLMPSLPPGAAAGQAHGADEGFSDDDGEGDFGEADIFASQGPPSQVPSLGTPSMQPLAPTALQELAAQPRSSSLPIILGVLLVAGAAGGYLYYQRFMAHAPEAAATSAPEQAAAPAQAPSAEPSQPGEGEPSAPGAAEGAKPEAAPPTGAKPAAEPQGAPSGPAQTVEVEISSLPRDSDILVDGKKVGTTPKHVALPLGRQAQVTVSAQGYASMTKAVTASANQEALRFRLEPLPFSLVVRTTPGEAELAVGSATALSPAPLALGHLEGGVQVSIAKDGFQRMTRLVRLDEFSQKDGVMRAEIEVTLNPLPGGGATPGAGRGLKGKRPRAEPPAPSPPAPGEAPAAAPEAAKPPPAAPAAEAPKPAAPEPPKEPRFELKPAPEGPPPEVPKAP